MYRKVVLILCLVVVLPATAVAQADPPVIHEAAVAGGWLTASVTPNGPDARARVELVAADGSFRVLSVTQVQGTTIREPVPALSPGERIRLTVFTTAGSATVLVAETVQPAPTATPTPVPTATPVPVGAVEGKSVEVAVLSGTVSYRAPDALTYTPLTGKAVLPLGVLLDTEAGKVQLTAQVRGKQQAGAFNGGKFSVTQTATGMTELALAGPLTCSTRERAQTSQKKKKKRTIWGKDSGGSFRTRGNGSVATVRGTEWRTTDTCAGTEIYVREGSVSVWPRRGGKSKLVRAGQRLFTPRPR